MFLLIIITCLLALTFEITNVRGSDFTMKSKFCIVKVNCEIFFSFLFIFPAMFHNIKRSFGSGSGFSAPKSMMGISRM
ncbi:hypothetical protein ES332_A05G007900v1 [Gossypium tomentosum]|uniref:Uncharacterized protein n=1 Tax=Gossypium tomentosum TaxID=34277 RepID=A0A5D2Q997_GOSTO|nr:hypothetical protein ES332_A05G007900v1 [Gossypium tomentosum]